MAARGAAETCSVCGAPAAGECDRCQTSVYCSAACQSLDWHSGHAVECATFIGANGDSAEQRRATRRQGVAQRRVVRPIRTGRRRTGGGSANVLPGAAERRVTVRSADGRATYSISVDLLPGEYEVYSVETRLRRRQLRDATRIFVVVTTLVQTRDEFDRSTRTLTIFKPLLPASGAAGDNVACVQIECPPQFPRNTSCWRCVEVIALPSLGERGDTEIERSVFSGRAPQPAPRPDDGDDDDDDDQRRRGDGGVVISIPGITFGAALALRDEELARPS